MNGRVEWRTSVTASALHAAAALVAGRSLTDVRLAALLREPANRLAATLSDLDQPARGWQRLLDVALGAAGGPDGFRFAQRADLPLGGAGVAERMDELVSAFVTALPRLPSELPLRAGPIREQWEARGPGLLARVARLTQLSLADPQPWVALVHPALGGGGAIHPGCNAIRFEALLVNAHSRLPEMVRLGWYLVQLAAWRQLTAVSEPHRTILSAVATLPAAVAAGQFVELIPDSDHMIDEAVAVWLPESPARPRADLLRTLGTAPPASWLETTLALAQELSYNS